MASARLLFFSALMSLVLQANAVYADDDAVANAEGFWEYTGLVTRDGQSLPLTGVFLISDDVFLQQSIFNEEPFASAGSMAHVGPYWGGGAGLRLTSTQTLSLDPGAENPLRSAGEMQHDLKVERDGDDLTLIFGGGTSTVQTFSKLGDARDTRLYSLQDGALAFADGHFILVVGDTNSVVSGYGRYTQSDESLELQVIRWAESDGKTVTNLKDITLSANFDESALVLEDGRRFNVQP